MATTFDTSVRLTNGAATLSFYLFDAKSGTPALDAKQQGNGPRSLTYPDLPLDYRTKNAGTVMRALATSEQVYANDVTVT